MSSFRKIISDSDKLGEFFCDKPLLRLARLNLTADQIRNEVLGFDSPRKVYEETEEKDVLKLGQMKAFASTCVNQSLDQVRQILDGVIENKEVQQIFLICFEALVSNSVLTLQETQSDKLRKKINLNEAVEATKRFDQKVDLLHSEWKRKQEKIDDKVNAKQSRIEKLKAEMELLSALNDEKIGAAIKDGNNKLAKDTRLKLGEVKELPEILKSVESEKEKSKRVSLQEVQKLKEQKVKVEQVLQSILAKFDQDVGVKAADLKKLYKTVQDQRKNFEIWKNTAVSDQIAMHEKLMKEKQEEETEVEDEEFSKH